MTELSSVRQFQAFEASRDATPMNGAASWLRSTIRRHRDLIVVVAFCAIGLILTIAMLNQSPDFTAAAGGITLVP